MHTDIRNHSCRFESPRRRQQAFTSFALIWCTITGVRLLNCIRHARKSALKVVLLERCLRV